MLKNLFLSLSVQYQYIIWHLGLFVLGFILIYGFLFWLLRPLFRRIEQDIALVSLNVSGYPILSIFTLVNGKFILYDFPDFIFNKNLQILLNPFLISIFSYWLVAIFKEVLIYYLKRYTQQTEVMWDDVLLPLVEAVTPVMIFLITSSANCKYLG